MLDHFARLNREHAKLAINQKNGYTSQKKQKDGKDYYWLGSTDVQCFHQKKIIKRQLVVFQPCQNGKQNATASRTCIQTVWSSKIAVVLYGKLRAARLRCPRLQGYHTYETNRSHLQIRHPKSEHCRNIEYHWCHLLNSSHNHKRLQSAWVPRKPPSQLCHKEISYSQEAEQRIKKYHGLSWIVLEEFIQKNKQIKN